MPLDLARDLLPTPSPGESIAVPEYARVFLGPGGAFQYLEAAVAGFLPAVAGCLRTLDAGCGNGYWARRLLDAGHYLVGVDASAKRIANARAQAPGVRFEQLEIGEDLLAEPGEDPFDVVISTEVVEHLFQPDIWARGALRALRPGGRLICSAPYHGYIKNLLIAVSGRWDEHHHTLRQVGHIKFFSEASLRRLLETAGFEQVRFRGAGRMPFLWKSIVMAAQRPT